jgi:hypothetical protein
MIRHRVICGATQSHRPSAMPRGTAAVIAMIAATVACQAIVTRLPLGYPIVFGTARVSSPGMDVCICDGGCIRGGQLEERRDPAEGLPDGVARQLSVVAPVPRHLPRLPARWK